jgi:hypothetical protein
MSNDQDSKRRYLKLNKKTLLVIVAAIVATVTLSANAFMDESTSAKKYDRSQALNEASACGNGKLPLNILCSNMGSEIQGDENAVGMTSAQQGGLVDEEPYENLVDEASMQSVMSEEMNRVAETRMSSVLEGAKSSSTGASNDFDSTPGVTMVTPGASIDKQIETSALRMENAQDFSSTQ